jgi:flagellar hook-associated protein 3 FlgL
MSGSIGGTGSNYSLLNTLIGNSMAVHQQLDTLTEQASTGLIAQTYAGLGAGAGVSLNLNPQLATLQTEQGNISRATGLMQVTQTAMTQIQQIAASFVADMPKLSEVAPAEIDTVAASARQALTQLANLLDTKQGNTYVFSGQDSGNPPVPNPDTIASLPSPPGSSPPGFYAQINAAVSALSAPGGAAAVVANTLTIAQSNASGTTPFSNYMSNSPSPPVVQTGEGNTIQIGLLASVNSTATSSGSSTTNSYMRDLMRALATIGSMSSAQASDTSNFTALVQDTTTSLNGAVTAMATDVGVLGNNQTALTNIQSSLDDTATALKGQVSAVQDVDMATTLSNLTATQTQLQASYRLISGANSLSLVNFLPT